METNRPSVWKQLTGALAGSALAIVGYMAYQSGSSALRAYIIPPGYDAGETPTPGIVLATTEVTDRRERLDAKARAAVERMRTMQEEGVVAARSASSHALVAMAASSSIASSASVSSENVMDAGFSSSLPVDAAHAAAMLIRTEERLNARMTADATSPKTLPGAGPELLVMAAGALGGTFASRWRKKAVH